jgi:Putative Ig domain
MAVPVMGNSAPPIAGPFGVHHQVVKGPSLGTFPPSYFNPIPVAAELKTGTTGTAYSLAISSQGGTGPYTFAITGGALPTGTSLNPSSGIISGTTTSAASYTFTITVTDANGFTGSQAFTVVVAAPASGGGYSATFLA